MNMTVNWSMDSKEQRAELVYDKKLKEIIFCLSMHDFIDSV